MNIREYRKKAGLSQKKLAETVGISQCYLCELEKGSKQAPTPMLLYKISKALMVSMEQLLVEKNDTAQQTETEGAAEADLTGYWERYGEEGLQKLMGRLRAVQEMALLKGDKRSAQRRAELAEALGVKPRCIYDWERKYEAEGLEGLMDKTMRADKGKPRCMCLLAQDRVNYLYMAPGKLS